MLAVLAQRTGQSPATMTIGTDLGRKSHAWVAIWHGPMMVLLAGEPSGKAGSFSKPFLKALILLFTSVCKMWVRIRLKSRGLLARFGKPGFISLLRCGLPACALSAQMSLIPREPPHRQCARLRGQKREEE